MRINLTKKDLVNAIYMQIGFSKKINENLIEDFFLSIIDNLKKNKKVKISNFGTFTLREKKIELEGIQRQKRKRLYQKEM